MSKLYLVQRRTWCDMYYGYDTSDYIEESGVPVAAFTKKADATAHARKLERQARAEASSLFLLLCDEVLPDKLGLSEEELVAAIRALGLDPPAEVPGRWAGYRHWDQWYDAIAESLTPAQRDGIAKLFARVKIYEVVEVPLEE